MSDVVCFWCERSNVAEESLRRYAGEKSCPLPYGYHNASVILGEVSIPPSDKIRSTGYDDLSHDDPRWPAACACG